MNRFEALHALGLEEDATDDEVRLSYYGLSKAVDAFDFSDAERIVRRVEGMRDHAKESKTFLLRTRNKTVARKVQSYSAKQRGKVTVTPVEEKTARLHGLERLRGVLIGYLDEERTKRRTSIFVLVGCIVVSFVTIRYLRAMPRIIAFSVLGAVAIAGSTVLTRSALQVRKARAHIAEVDDAIGALRRELGLDPEEVAEEPGSGEGLAGLTPGMGPAAATGAFELGAGEENGEDVGSEALEADAYDVEDDEKETAR